MTGLLCVKVPPWMTSFRITSFYKVPEGCDEICERLIRPVQCRVYLPCDVGDCYFPDLNL